MTINCKTFAKNYIYFQLSYTYNMLFLNVYNSGYIIMIQIALLKQM